MKNISLAKASNGCPRLFLAPMEGVGDRCFRKAMAHVGGFDEAVRDFLRVPANAHIKSLAQQYCAGELSPIPLAAQLMGGDPDLMGAMAAEIERLGAPRIDLNCGCPSNTVTGRGAGSSLLKDPSHLYAVAKKMVDAVSIPVTAKLRSGFEDTTLFQENVLAAQESGIAYLTLHPRTKREGYAPPADWTLIARAKSLLRIPVVGNGDILHVEDALKMLRETGCDALMIGRGSIINPFIFKEIQAHFSGFYYSPSWCEVRSYLEAYMSEMPPSMSERIRINKMKQLLGFLFKQEALASHRDAILRSQHADVNGVMQQAFPLLQEVYAATSNGKNL